MPTPPDLSPSEPADPIASRCRVRTGAHRARRATLWLLSLLCAFTASLACAGSRGLLYEATPPAGQAAGTLWLLGTVHLGTAALYPLSDEVNKALDAAARVAVEADSTDQVAAQAALVGGLYGPGDSLGAHLPAALHREILDALALRGLPEVMGQRMKPFLTAMTLSVVELQRHGYDAARGIDNVVIQRARAAGKPVIALESFAQQIELFDAVDAASQVALLDATVQSLNDGSLLRNTADMYGAWQRGDADGLAEVVQRDMDRLPETAQRALQAKLFDERNVAMLDRVLALHAAEGGMLLVAIGAGHLLAETGLVEQLRQRGWQVEQR